MHACMHARMHARGVGDRYAQEARATPPLAYYSLNADVGITCGTAQLAVNAGALCPLPFFVGSCLQSCACTLSSAHRG